MSHINRIALAALPAAIAMISVSAMAASAWNSASVYVAGDVVSYANKDYKAKWWTQGNVPGADQWGPWELQATAPTLAPTSTPSTPSTPSTAPTVTPSTIPTASPTTVPTAAPGSWA